MFSKEAELSRDSKGVFGLIVSKSESSMPSQAQFPVPQSMDFTVLWRDYAGLTGNKAV
jgi:hypothetical protein